MSEELQIEICGDSTLPTLIYLPGLHGDGTLSTPFQIALEASVRLVIVTYPHSTTATIGDYAEAIRLKLSDLGINSAWLLGESFGSQVAWELLKTNSPPQSASADSFRASGLILAGGFVKHPLMGKMRALGWMVGIVPLPLWNAVFRLFGLYLKLLHWRSKKVRDSINEFIQRRDESDRRVMRHRLKLLDDYDPRVVATQTRLPIYYLGGLFDPLVPVFKTRRWLRQHCPGFRDGRIFCFADHIVLYSAASRSATLVQQWMKTPLS